MKILKISLIVLGGLLLTLSGFVAWYLHKDRGDKYPRPAYDSSMVPHFNAVDVPFKTLFNKKESLPLIGSAVIDVDNDGREEFFVGGGMGQNDAFFKYTEDGFVNITQRVNFTKNLSHTTYGAATIDIDSNGFTDLAVARDNAIYLYLNRNGVFDEPINLNLPFNEKSQPVSITFADLNNDGWVDMFVSSYIKKHLMEGQTIFNKEGYGGTSQLYINNGDNTFSDITEKSGLTYVHNTFCAVFVDLNNDNLPDLVVAHDTGEPRIYRNNGNLNFSMVNHPLTGVYSYPMGIAVGDYDNDGFQDIMFSNVGKSLPAFLLRGDLNKNQTLITDWILFHNNGDFTFSNKAKEAKIANYEFSWGAVFEDFNLDGLQDLVVSENYVDLPNSRIMPLPSRFLMQLEGNEFTNIEGINNTQNPYNGITPLIADFNLDGYPDLIHINLNGKLKAYISRGNLGNNYINVKTPETAAYLNARITVELKSGKTISLQKVSGEGLASDQSHLLFVGLGKETEVKSCKINLTSGVERNIEIASINKIVEIL